MPKYCYEPKNFRPPALLAIQRANQIIAEYSANGYDLTLRQIYYQFVSRGWIANKDSEYHRLGTILSEGRLAGLIDWEAMTDRTRQLRKLTQWENPQEIIDAVARSYHTDWWSDQEFYVEVWVEKDALIGVIQRACNPLDVPYFSCRGYTSQTEMWNAGQRVATMIQDGRKPVIIHLGDHDPSGIEMTKDIERRLSLFTGEEIELERIALTYEQVEMYRPPRNPAKQTDPRFKDYQRQYGSDSWELDALDPVVIDRLITEKVSEYIDFDRFDQAQIREQEQADMLKQVSTRWDDVEEYIAERVMEG